MRRLLVAVIAIVGTLFAVPATAAAASPGYVALGDSYSSGVGTGTYTLSATCKRSTKAYPYLYSGTATGFVACSGASVDNVRATQLSSVTSSATLVTLTVGGNDVGFNDVVTRCTAFTSDATCTNAVNAAMAKIPGMQTNLTKLLGEISSNAPTASIVLLGYPYLYSTGSCGFGQPSLTKRKALHDGADALDAALKNAVVAAAVAGSRQFVDVRSIFTGHDICASSTNRWINGLNLFNSGESFHPNSSGQANGYLPALQSALKVAV